MGADEQIVLPEGLEWVPGSDANEAEGVVTGTDDDGNALYVARARTGDETGTACFVSGASEVVMGFFGQVLNIPEYDLLIASSACLKWVPACDGELPDGAIAVGKDEKKRLIYIARVRIGSIVVPAKLILKFHGAFAGWNVMEYLRRKYEVLCVCAEDAEDEQIDVHEVPSNDDIDLTDGHDDGDLVDERKDQVPVPDGLAWCYAEDGNSFDNAVKSGTDKEDKELHVVRGSEEWELAPGVLRIGDACASIPYYKLGSKHDKYEVLVNEGEIPLKWVKAQCGDLPDNAVAAGVNRKGELMYVARCNIAGVWTPGKLNISTKRGYAAQDGCEFTRKKYEVLCLAEEGEEIEEHPSVEDEEEEEHIEDDDRVNQVPEVENVSWASCKDGEIPSCAIVIDGEGDGQQCVARASEENELVTGGVCAGESAIVPYYGVAVDCEVYQCLINNSPDDCPMFWVPIVATEIPDQALQCGVNNDGIRIFVTRVKVEDSPKYCPGKLLEGSEQGCFAHNDDEVSVPEFEILCVGAEAEELDGAVPVVLCE